MNISSTSTDFHPSVLVSEIISLFDIKPDTIFIDATLGHGGHTIEILKHQGIVYGLDADPNSLKIASLRIHSLGYSTHFHPIHTNFNRILEIARQIGKPITGLVFDLGLNQGQYHTSSGFSFSKNQPLDMRLDPTDRSLTAADIINHYSEEQLYFLFSKYSQEKYSKEIAHAICQSRTKKMIKTTEPLVSLISKIYQIHRHRIFKIHPATKVFMALRMAVNQELENLTHVLSSSLNPIFKQSIFCFISFHSGEDRLIKQFIISNSSALKSLTPKPIRPSPTEIKQNPSSRSATLRSYKIL